MNQDSQSQNELISKIDEQSEATQKNTLGNTPNSPNRLADAQCAATEDDINEKFSAASMHVNIENTMNIKETE